MFSKHENGNSLPRFHWVDRKQNQEIRRPYSVFGRFTESIIKENIILENKAFLGPFFGTHKHSGILSTKKQQVKKGLDTYKMIRWFIEKNNVRFFESYFCKCNSAFLTT